MSLFNTLVPTFGRQPLARRDSANGDTDESLPSMKPHYEIHETDDAFGVAVHLPGVAKDDVELTAEEGVLTIVGRRGWKRPESWTLLYRESSDAPYRLELTHDNVIDLDKVHAELRDGVLRISLPKTESIKPRKIAVN